ncbi:hypothetical protein HELRODRAFT_170842 [Helobdella robusta]|uniref:PDZ domain-containing protein n=1 Tax=Helobdella robusta TaxID=6412 RepID=T1F3I1_HELRO|nr:hypothetical protein HELRODRAFT_170842 [Helobdella robusta]ESO06821.1 hypothetical protein HELRODRAFT_170842 [Helobdella robusta]
MDHMAAIPLNLSNSFRFSSTSIHRGRSDYGDNRSSSSSSSSNVTKNKTTAYTIATTTATTTTTKITTSRSSNEWDLKQICDTYAGRLSLKEKNEKPTKGGKILAVAKVAGDDGTSGGGGRSGGGGGGDGRSGATCMDDVERHKQITTSHSTALTDLTYTSNNNNNTTPNNNNNNNSDINKNNNINRRSNGTGSQNEPTTHQSLPHPLPPHPPPSHPPRSDVTIAASKQDIPRSDSNDIQFDNEDDDDDDEEDEELMASMHLLNSNNNNDDDDVLISCNDRHHHHHHQPVTSQISSASSSRHPDDVTDLFIERSKMPLGLRLIGGSNTAMKNVYVSEIIKDGAIDLDGRLKVGDVILEINGHKLDQTLNNNNINNSNNNSNISNIVNNNKNNKNTASTNNNTNVNNINKHINNFNDDDIARAYYLLQQNNNNLKLLIKRSKNQNNNNNTSNDSSNETSTTNNNRNNNSRQNSNVSNSLKDYSTLEFNNISYYDNFTLELVRKVNKGLGICFSYGHYNNSLLVTNIIKGSAVDIDGRLMVGDEIVAVNGEEIGEGDLKVTKLKLVAGNDPSHCWVSISTICYKNMFRSKIKKNISSEISQTSLEYGMKVLKLKKETHRRTRIFNATYSGKVTLKVNRIKKIATHPVI